MDLTGTGRGKLILFGEHAAVYGFPALGTPLPLITTAVITPGKKQEWEVAGAPAEFHPLVKELLVREIQILSEKTNNGKMLFSGGICTLTSDIPYGVGYGSSAALCTALSSALIKGAVSPGIPRKQCDYLTWITAHKGEQLFHGTPSGIDTGLSLSPGLMSFLPSPPALPESRSLKGTLVPIITGAVERKKTAGKLIGDLRERYKKGEETVVRHIRILGKIAENAVELFSLKGRPDPSAAAALADEAQKSLQALNLSSPEIDNIISYSNSIGALGGKLSGAGGGGAFFIIPPANRDVMEIAGRIGRFCSKNGIQLSAELIGVGTE